MVNPATSAEWRVSVSDSVKGGMGPGGGGKHRRPSIQRRKHKCTTAGP